MEFSKFFDFVDFENPFFRAGAAYVVFMFMTPAVFTLIGKALYYCGLKKIGHYIVGMYSWGDIWLVDKCPYFLGDKCRCWTCPAYDSEHRYMCVFERTDYPF